MNSDLIELLQCLNEYRVKYLVIGGQAVIYYAEPRYTKDLDILVEASRENSKRLVSALHKFGAPVDNLNDNDFAKSGILFVFGIAPNRVDILTGASGVRFSAAWKNRVTAKQGKTITHFCSVKDLIKMKKSAGRPQDLLDIDALRAAVSGESHTERGERSYLKKRKRIGKG